MTTQPDRAAGTAGKATRITALDGLRGIAACGVAFLYHPLLELHPAVMARAPAPIVWMRDWGWSFVDLFFLISGFIFAHVYLRERRLDRAGLAEFAVARVARLYPLHLATFAVCVLLFFGAPENTWYALVAHLFMLQAFVEPLGHTFNGPSWSISVELACYALFALGTVSGERTLRWVTAAAILVPVFYLVLLARPGGPWIADCIPRGPLGFFLGQVLWRCREPVARVPAAILAVLVAIGLTLDAGRFSPLLPLCLLAWPAAVCLALRLPLLASRPLLWLGDRSYSIYLVHFPLLLVCIPQIESTTSGWVASAMLAGFAGVVLVLSDLAYRRLEVPARGAIRGAWRRRRKAALPDGVAA
ncbi:acyltransferase [Novosphingobium resinovorum]|uniref:acyltransferase family protein n=1 Tax=Novosphingobium resinovorum TaxID=158500 RepID=UPI002ED48735|nr:acyltransferase [Novosphingobium resinovorum]